jgi:hypothetical protein
VFSGQAGTNPAWAAPNSSETSSGAFIAANVPANYNAQAQMLLRTSTGTACNYCHIDSSIGVKVVYAGQSDIFGYAQNFTSSFAHNYHEAGCGDCHAVHGANTYGGAMSSAILHKRPRLRDPQREVIGATASSNTDVPAIYATLDDAYAGTDRNTQQTAFCSSCHYVYNTSSAQAIKERGGTAGFTKHHPMADALTSRTAAAGTAKGANNTVGQIQWAWVGSNTCRSCHSAGLDGSDPNSGLTGYTDQSFPHYTKGNYRFLNQVSDAEYATDEVCLDCHRNSGGTAGVGISF